MDQATENGLQRDLGRLEATVAAQGVQLATMDRKLDSLVRASERDQGTRRALVAVGGAGGSIAGALVAAAVEWWKG